MAICCGGKKQKVSHSITSSIKNRRSSEKHNGILDHQHSNLKGNSSPRHRSQSHFNHHLPMPHDLSRSSANSASSSALTYSNGTSQTPSNNNHYYHKNPKKMDISDDDDDEEFPGKDQQQKNAKYSSLSQTKQSTVHADMIFYCFEILGNYLFNGKHHLGKHHSNINGQSISSSTNPPALPTDSYPLFVTWLIGSDQKLRGCIGTFTPMNLAQGFPRLCSLDFICTCIFRSS